MHRQPPAQAAAPADLDGVAEHALRSRARRPGTNRWSRRARSTSTTRCVPSTEGPSSSLVIRNAMLPRWCGMAADEFLAWRSPWRRGRSSCPRRRGRRACRRGLRAGSGSRLPLLERPRRHDIGMPREAEHGRLAVRAGPRSCPRCPKRRCSTLKPIASSRSHISAWQPPSVGLTDARDIKSQVRSSVLDT